MRSIARILCLIVGSLLLCQGPGAATKTAWPISDSSTTRITYPMPARDRAVISEVSLQRDLTPTDPSTDRTTITGGSDEQRATVTWALGRYADAGLDLPVLHFDLHPDASGCSGNRGYFSPSSTPWMVAICTDERFLVLHELGHAWAEHTLSDVDRTAFVEFRGLESWNDPETSWRARASEDAANTLAWGLLETPIRHISPTGSLAERSQAFRLLTGFASPRISQ